MGDKGPDPLSLERIRHLYNETKLLQAAQYHLANYCLCKDLINTRELSVFLCWAFRLVVCVINDSTCQSVIWKSSHISISPFEGSWTLDSLSLWVCTGPRLRAGAFLLPCDFSCKGQVGSSGGWGGDAAIHKFLASSKHKSVIAIS